jgi:hypothetical protein
MELRAIVCAPSNASLPDGVDVVPGDLFSARTLGPALREVESV